MVFNNGGHGQGRDGFGYRGRGVRGFARGRGGHGDQGESVHLEEEFNVTIAKGMDILK